MKKLLTSIWLAVAAGSAGAVTLPPSLFTLTGGSLFTPLANDFGSSSVTRGATVGLAADAILTYTFLFREAGLTNTFQVAGSSVFNSSAPVGTRFAPSAPTRQGTIDFGFIVPAVASVPNVVTNGTNASMTSQGNASFAARILSGTSVLLYLDDIGRTATGWVDDDDYDDMVVRIDAVSINPIPEASTVMMMTIGAGLIGWVGSRRRKA
jgi:PEP-CTERM motif